MKLNKRKLIYCSCVGIISGFLSSKLGLNPFSLRYWIFTIPFIIIMSNLYNNKKDER